MKSRFTLILVLIFSPFLLFSQGEWTVYSKDKLNAGSLKTGNYTRNFCEDNTGTLWVSTSKGGILQFSDNNWELYDVRKISFLFGQSDAANIINAKTGTTCDWFTALDNNGKYVWFGASKGVVLWTGKDMLEMTGVTDDNKRMIFHSNAKDEYYVITNTGTQKYNVPESFEKKPVIQISSVLTDMKNRLWLGQWEGLVYCLEDGKWRVYEDLNKVKLEVKEKHGYRRVHKIFEDAGGDIWFLTYTGVAKYKDGKISIIKHVLYPKAIYQDSKKNIWIAHESGIEQFDGTNWKSYERDEDKGMRYFMNEAKFLEDKNGNLWFSSRTDFATRKGGGLYLLEGEEWKDMKCEKYHTNIHEDKNGTLWCTGMRGIYQYKDGEFKKLRQSEGFATFYFEMFEDSKGNIWFGTSTVGGHIEMYSPN